MQQKTPTHLCWNCEGEVSFQEPKCPYCGVQLHYAEDEQEASASSELKEQAPYTSNFSQDWSSAVSQSMEEQEVIAKKEGVQGMLLPLLLLLAGGVFFFFGAMLLLFSQNGELVLRWSQGYWMLYWGLAAPTLWIGWRALRQLGG